MYSWGILRISVVLPAILTDVYRSIRQSPLDMQDCYLDYLPRLYHGNFFANPSSSIIHQSSCHRHYAESEIPTAESFPNGSTLSASRGRHTSQRTTYGSRYFSNSKMIIYYINIKVLISYLNQDVVKICSEYWHLCMNSYEIIRRTYSFCKH